MALWLASLLIVFGAAVLIFAVWRKEKSKFLTAVIIAAALLLLAMLAFILLTVVFLFSYGDR